MDDRKDKVMTKKELLEAIEDMPMDVKITGVFISKPKPLWITQVNKNKRNNTIILVQC